MDIDWPKLLSPLSREERQIYRQKQSEAFRAFSDFSRLAEEDRVLDFGCRQGDFLFFTASKIGSACGIDISEEDILKARKRNSNNRHYNLRFLSGQIGSLELDEESFSAIISRFSIHDIYEYNKVFSEMFRLIHLSGRIAINEQIKWGDEIYDKFWDEFGKLLDVGHHQYVSRGFLVDLFYSKNLKILEELQLTQWVSLRELIFLNPMAFNRTNEIITLLQKIHPGNIPSDLIVFKDRDLNFRIKYYLILGGYGNSQA